MSNTTYKKAGKLFAVHHGDYAGQMFALVEKEEHNYNFLSMPEMKNISVTVEDFNEGIEKEIIKFSKMSKQEVHDWYWSMEDILIHNFNLFMEYGKNREQNYKNLFEELK